MLCRVLNETSLHHIERRERSRATHRVSTEGRSVRAGLPLRDRFSGDDRANRHSTRESFCNDENIRFNAFVLAREHLSRTADTTLDLVEHEQDSMPVAQLS